MSSSITTFVNAIYKFYEKTFSNVEDEQQLPPKKDLAEVCEILVNVSCMREEGRYPAFRVCFINPESEFLEAYLYAHVLLFKKPIEFNKREIHKLAPALNPDMSYLVVDISKRPFKAVGVIGAYTAWEKIITKELVSGNRMPRIPNLLVSSPGEIEACFGEATFLVYSAGSTVCFRTDTFTSTLVAEQLKSGGSVPERERLKLLYRVLWMMTKIGHGGAILIVPSAQSCAKLIDLKYPMPTEFLFGYEDKYGDLPTNAREKNIITYANLIARFSAVDGSVVLTKDFDLVGFGAETLTDKMGDRSPSMCFMEYDNTENEARKFKDNGMRHRAAYRFCNAVEGSVAFVISQDGSIEACTKHGGKVVVYENVALPML